MGLVALALVVGGCSASGERGPDAGAPVDASADAEPLMIVGLGDSIQTSTDDEGKTFLAQYAERYRAATGNAFEVTSLAGGANTSETVLASLSPGAPGADAVAKADVVVITVGGNDADPFGSYPAGTCAPRSRPVDCLHAYVPNLESNLEKILTAVDELKRRTRGSSSPALTSTPSSAGRRLRPIPSGSTSIARSPRRKPTSPAAWRAHTTLSVWTSSTCSTERAPLTTPRRT